MFSPVLQMILFFVSPHIGGNLTDALGIGGFLTDD